MEYSERKPAKSFRDLEVWQEAYKLSIRIYKTCDNFPNYERYGLANQMTRASVSVCSNIAEGFGRQGAKVKNQFFSNASGSLMELENQLLIAEGIGYLDHSKITDLLNLCTSTHKLLNSLIRVNKEKGARS